MIFIKTHKDFDLQQLNIDVNKYNEFAIISRNKLLNDYGIKFIYDKHNYINKWKNIYGELTYHYYVYTHINEFDDIIGFIQYKRTFNKDILDNYKILLSAYDVILPYYIDWKYIHLTLITQYDACHIPGLLKNVIDIIYEYFPEYKNYDLYNIYKIIPHNMFIMKKKDYIEYCKFMFECLELFNVRYNMYKYNNDITYDRILSFIGERLSTIFYFKYFKNIYFSSVKF